MQKTDSPEELSAAEILEKLFNGKYIAAVIITVAYTVHLLFYHKYSQSAHLLASDGIGRIGVGS